MTGPEAADMLPPIEDLTGPAGRLSSPELASAILEQMGEPPMPGYAAHRRRQYNLPDVSYLKEQMGLR